MNFTNTDCAMEDMYWYFDCQLWNQVDYQVWNQVDDQINWKVYDHHKPIKIKILQEMNK